MAVQPFVGMVDPKPSAAKFAERNYPQHVGCYWGTIAQAR